MNIELIQGNCLTESDKIESGSVDLILTDLPYGTVTNIASSDTVKHGMQNKTNWDCVIETEKIYEIANRILRKNGKMILFAQQPFTTELISKQIPNLPFNYSMIWKKDHFANSLIAKKAPLNYYEDVLVFSKTHDFEGIHPLRPYFKEVFEYIGHTKKTILEQVGQKADHVFRFNSSQFDLCTNETYEALIHFYCIDKMEGFKMNIKRIKRIKRIQLRALYEAKDLLATKLFSTMKHSYTVGDMITLSSFMILLCAFVYISLIIGIN